MRSSVQRRTDETEQICRRADPGDRQRRLKVKDEEVSIDLTRDLRLGAFVPDEVIALVLESGKALAIPAFVYQPLATAARVTQKRRPAGSTSERN
jgi:hypothetical protein